jgi:hypothetical protein
MKYLSIFILAIFINFTALPSLAAVFDWDLPTLNTNINEEEVKNNFANFNEKLPPKPFDFKEFINYSESSKTKNLFIIKNDSIHLSPYISIFSPPPEV